MPINKNEITKELIEKAMQCKSADELMKLRRPRILTFPWKKPRPTWRSWTILNWTNRY